MPSELYPRGMLENGKLPKRLDEVWSEYNSLQRIEQLGRGLGPCPKRGQKNDPQDGRSSSAKLGLPNLLQ